MSLTIDKAYDMINLAIEMRSVNKGYRFGQALWNELYTTEEGKKLIENFINTEYDFYYWKDDKKVEQVFWEKYVKM